MHRAAVRPKLSKAASPSIRKTPEDVAEHLLSVLDDWPRWEQVVEKQVSEIAEYPERGYGQRLMTVWEATVQSHAARPEPS